MQISRKGYYLNFDIAMEIVKSHIHRETFFLPYDDNNKAQAPIRWLNASCLRFMKRHMLYFKFFDKRMNVYHSLATYKEFPTFALDWKLKSQQQQLWLTRFSEYIQEYDLFLETDSTDIEESKADTIKVTRFLEEFKIVYCISASGSKGMHVVVPYAEFKHLKFDVYNENKEVKAIKFNDVMRKFPLPLKQLQAKIDLVMLFKAIAIRLKHILGCPTLDTSVQDIKRVRKTPYSIDVKSGSVAYPLTDDQLKDYKREMYMPEKVLRMNNHKRGLLYRNTEQAQWKREAYVTNMLKELDILK